MTADGTRAAVVARCWGADAAIVLALLIGCAYAANAYLRAYNDGGGVGQFYRGSFDVAVMDGIRKVMASPRCKLSGARPLTP